MNPTLALLAAGMSTRYGRLKQLEPVGPGGEALLDYAAFDARRAGFARVVLIIREELEESFRAHVDGRWPEDLDVVFHHQRLEDLPGFDPGSTAAGELLSRREKPWGTAHALLAARRLFPEPFLVLNADDFYGPAAYSQALALMSRDLRQDPRDPPGFGLVAYALDETLSRHGGVSRGVCRVDGNGLLEEVREVLGIRRSGAQITGTAVEGDEVLLSGREPVSTNFWIFTPEIFPFLEDGFQTFLEGRPAGGSGGEPEEEFLIPSEVNRLLSRDEARVWVLRTDDPFFGITHPPDREWVAGGLRELIHEGRYPETLWTTG